MHVYRYPHYGHARPGTNCYERGGHAYGAWSGGGSWGAVPTTPAAVAMIPEPLPAPSANQQAALDRQVFASALQDQARTAKASAITAAALNDPFAFAAQDAAAKAMATQARDVAEGAAEPAVSEAAKKGLGIGAVALGLMLMAAWR